MQEEEVSGTVKLIPARSFLFSPLAVLDAFCGAVGEASPRAHILSPLGPPPRPVGRPRQRLLERPHRRLQDRLEGDVLFGVLLGRRLVQLDRGGEARRHRSAARASRAEGVHEVRAADPGGQRRRRRPHRDGEGANVGRWSVVFTLSPVFSDTKCVLAFVFVFVDAPGLMWGLASVFALFQYP